MNIDWVKEIATISKPFKDNIQCHCLKDLLEKNSRIVKESNWTHQDFVNREFNSRNIKEDGLQNIQESRLCMERREGWDFLNEGMPPCKGRYFGKF